MIRERGRTVIDLAAPMSHAGEKKTRPRPPARYRNEDTATMFGNWFTLPPSKPSTR
jgi:hypothetical protein